MNFFKDSTITLEQILLYITDYGINLLLALLIFIIGKWFSKKIVSLLRNAMRKAKIDAMLVAFLSNITYTLLLSFAVIAALSKLGVETTSIAAIFAAAGLAIGLALQGSLSNFAAGVMIVIFRPFTMEDFVELNGTSGTVKEIGIFTTTLKTGDNKIIIVPNAKFTSNELTNYSTESTRRIDLIIGCGYQDNLQRVKEVLSDIMAKNPKIMETPAPLIAVSELGDNSVNLIVRPWVKTEDYWTVKFEILEAVKNAFDNAGLSIPYPQRDVHIYKHLSDIAK